MFPSLAGRKLVFPPLVCSDSVLSIIRLISNVSTKVRDSNTVSVQGDEMPLNGANGCQNTTFNKKNRPFHEHLATMKRERESRVDESDYYFENGLRKVHPYYYTFSTFCKKKWFGKSLREIYSSEFRYNSDEHIERARRMGHLQVNLKPVESLEVKLNENDLLSSRLHYHEEPVPASEIKILHSDPDYLVVDKPSSIPVHPVSRYRYNTLCVILRKEFGYENLRLCHRLDKLTSGIVIFGKSQASTHKIQSEIFERTVEKEYICKVAGEFPVTDNGEGIICDQPVTVFDRRIGCCCAWKVDGCEAKDASTYFSRLSTDGETSVVLCKPKTGRTHQIRVHLQYLGYPIVNDPLYNHDAWGEERFRPGPCNKDVFQVVRKIAETYYFDPYIRERRQKLLSESNNHVNSFYSEKDSTQTTSSKLDATNNPHFCPTCQICNNPLPDSETETLVMCLHAYRYKGSDWEFKSDKPLWAYQDTAN